MIDLQDQWDAKPNRWLQYIAIAAAALVVINIVLWLAQSGGGKGSAAREALDKELTQQKTELDNLQASLFDQRKQLENAKNYIDGGLAQDRKKASQQYQVLVAHYEADTERYRQVGSEYNKKVSEFQSMDTSHKRWILVPFPIQVNAD